MNEPIRADKDDRYVSEKGGSKKKPSLAKPKADLFKSKRIILLLILLIAILLLSFLIFKPTKQEQQSASNTNELNQQQNQNDNTSSNFDDHAVSTLTPPAISREATQTEQLNTNGKKRIEIPGEVTDLLAQKIVEINGSKEADSTNIQLKSENKTVNTELSELVLPSTIPDNHYTIQLIASSSIESIMASVKANKLSNYQIYETKRNNKPWFVLIKGNYATLEEAKQAIKGLSAEWQKNSPWIKSGASVNKEKVSNAH